MRGILVELQGTWVNIYVYIVAPEVMCRLEHNILVDYYALGVIVFELMLGRRPYNGKSR